MLFRSASSRGPSFHQCRLRSDAPLASYGWWRQPCRRSRRRRRRQRQRPPKGIGVEARFFQQVYDRQDNTRRGSQLTLIPWFRKEAPLAYCPLTKPPIDSWMMIRTLVIALCLLIAAVPTWASTGSTNPHRAARSSSRYTKGRPSRPTMPRRAPRSAGRTTSRQATTRSKSSAKKCATCTRTANGRIARSRR